MTSAARPPASFARTGPYPTVIGHRGASAAVPENTLPAFRAAWDAGARWVEADTQPTADGVPVILHDNTLDRTTSGSGPVRRQPAAALAALTITGRPDARVPALADLLELLTADRALLLEIKGEHSAGQVAGILRSCAASGRDGQVYLQSFEESVLLQLRAQQPGRAFGLLMPEVDADPVRRCRELGAASYNPDYRAVLAYPAVVPRLHAAGIDVAVWTCDDPAAWDQLTAAGVDAIITNTPAELLAWQARNSAGG